MPRTAPPRFSSAVMLADMNARNTSPGTVARAKSSAVFVRSNSVSLSSRHTLRISLEHPPGPGSAAQTLGKSLGVETELAVPGRNRGPPLESAGASLVAACVSIRPTFTRLEVPKLPLSALGEPWTLALAAHNSMLPFPSLLFLNHRNWRNGSWSKDGVACALDQICPQPSGKIVNSVCTWTTWTTWSTWSTWTTWTPAETRLDTPAGTRLRGTHLPDTHLPETHLPETHLPRTHLPRTHLPRTHFAKDTPARTHLPGHTCQAHLQEHTGKDTLPGHTCQGHTCQGHTCQGHTAKDTPAKDTPAWDTLSKDTPARTHLPRTHLPRTLAKDTPAKDTVIPLPVIRLAHGEEPCPEHT